MSGYLMQFLEDRSLMPRDKHLRVGILGTGVMGRAIAGRVSMTPGMMVAKHLTRSVDPASIIQDVDIVVDASGDVVRGVRAALAAIEKRVPFLSFSAETDATVGPALARRARANNSFYGVADGDQPGCLLRMYADALMWGWDVKGFVSCKGFLDHNSTPTDMEPWVHKAAGTRPQMLCSFADGTKMQLEQNVVANHTGFLPTMPGMVGVKTSLAHVVEDLSRALVIKENFLAYTLGGDFGGGVGLVIKDRDEQETRLHSHYKLGGVVGPLRYIHRTFHGCHFEVPVSIAEAIYLQVEPVEVRPWCRTVALAKTGIGAGSLLDGIGGYKVRGELRIEKESEHLLPVGMSRGAVLKRNVQQGEAIGIGDVVIASDMVGVRDLFMERVW